VVEYEGGSDWLGVQTATSGSGYMVVGARPSTVGVGGFSTGGWHWLPGWCLWLCNR